MSERLVAWIRGRLDELEAAAKAADGKPWRVTDDEDDLDGDRLVLFRTLRSNEGSLIITDRDGYLTTEDLQHMALNDPAAVLARVAADRAMLADLLAEPHFLDESEWYGCQAVTRDGQPTGDECTCGRDERAARRVRLMAEALGWTGGSSE